MENLSANLATLPVRTDHRHGSRLEERLHRRSCGHLRTLRCSLEMIERRLERELDVDDAVANVSRRPIAGIEKALHHLVIARQHVRIEDTNARGTCQIGKPFEHPGSDAAPVESFGDRECNFRPFAVDRIPVVRRERHNAVPNLPDEGGSFVRAPRYQPLHSFGIWTSHAEETVIAAGRRERLEERAQRRHIRRCWPVEGRA